MQSIFEYITNNKEWLFSGIGVLLVLALSKFIKNIIDKRKPQKDSPPQQLSNNKYSNDNSKLLDLDSYSTHPTASEIIEEVRALPAYQQENCSDTYSGLKVKWTGELSSLVNSPFLEDEVNLIFTCDSDRSAYISAGANINEHPRIKSIKTGHNITVYGEIKSISSGTPRIKAHKIIYHDS